LASYPALDLRYGPGAGPLQDLLYAELDAFEPLAIHEHDGCDGWRVFFPSAFQRDSAYSALRSAFGGRLTAVAPVDVEDEDWARRSQAALGAVRVGRIIVAPPWDVPESADWRPAGHDSRGTERRAISEASGASSDPIVIVIEPSMGFGTGHHETTRLCLELLQQIDLHRKHVLDVGTGSAVLALSAWRLGASPVSAVDCDADALQSARENIARNGAIDAIELIGGDIAALSVDRADIVLANLTGAVLQRQAARLNSLLRPGGSLVVSGFSPDEIDGVLARFGPHSAHAAYDGEWAAAVISPSAQT
jgi:ribosomal protein L11 methyltransferase